MNQRSDHSDPPRPVLSSELTWSKLYSFLRPRVKFWVHSSHVSSWCGQENDIADDVVQEAVMRTFKYMRRAQNGEAPAVASLEGLSLVIARNYIEDLRRHDHRLVPFERDGNASEARTIDTIARHNVDLVQSALENVFLEWLYIKLSQEIVKFSYKQRTALLIDLANLMHFDTEPTLLQEAFLKVEIQLQDYQRPLPQDPVLRSRHASNVSLAYRRIRQLGSSDPQFDPVA